MQPTQTKVGLYFKCRWAILTWQIAFTSGNILSNDKAKDGKTTWCGHRS